MSASLLAGVAVAGAIGAPARYLLDGFISARVDGAFPWGTLVVNVTGSLLLGLITGASLYHAFPDTSRIWLGTGFCGAYTTFSTFTVDTVLLLEDGAVGAAARNVVASVLSCTVAAGVGLAVMAVV
ncbi:MAG: fluoride efflux transporter CrcB [Acidimicrobiales bacterium]